jgi:DNA invertase Pin-like site-specific DNA recombinase
MRDLSGQAAVIYLRISDDREGRALGVERQEEDCRALAEKLGVTIIKVFCDNDRSASTNTDEYRPDYEDMMQLLGTGTITVVISYTSSRLTRKPVEHERQLTLARTRGTQFYYVRGQALDLQVAANRRMARWEAANNAGEAEELQERVVRKKLADAVQGKTNGGPRAYGYGLIVGPHPVTGKDLRDPYKLVDHEVAVLHECKERVLAGESQMLIVKSLNTRGIPTAKGYQWTVGKLRRTLLNHSYVIFDADDPNQHGTRTHKGAEYRGAYPGIFTRVEHEMLSTIFQHNQTPYGDEPSGRSYLLSGFTYCGLCGGKAYGQNKHERGKKIRRYHCKKYNNRGEQVGCHRIFRIADPVEYLVSEAVLYRFDSPAIAEALAPAVDKEHAHELTQQLVQLQQRRKTLAEEHALNPYEDYPLMLGAIKTRIAAIQAQLAKIRSDSAKKALLPTDCNLRTVWGDASLEWRAAVIKLLVKRVVIHPSKPGGTIWNSWRFDPASVTIEWAV